MSGSGNVRFFSFCFWAIVLPPILLSAFSVNSIFFFFNFFVFGFFGALFSRLSP